jgi:hypothetical protein
MAKPAMNEHSRRLADEAGRRGWQYFPSGDHLRLARRWNWRVRYEHPFELRPQSKLGLEGRYGHVGDLISGTTLGGRAFWAFWHSLSDNVPHGFASHVRRSVAFIYTDRALPTVSVADRNRTGVGGTNPAQGILAIMQESTGRKLQKRPGVDAGRPGRTSDWAVGSEEFQRRYRVRAEDGRAAEWLAGPAIQPVLLSRRPAVSLTSHGADILAWTDYGWTGPNGVTDYGSERIGNVQDLDIVTIEALLEVLDMIPLST